MVTLETFIKDVKKINKEGDFRSAYEMLNYVLQQNRKDVEGRLIDYEYIINKYKNYCEKWDQLYGRKLKEGYLGKDVKMKLSIDDFIAQDKFTSEYETKERNFARDKYFFNGNVDNMYERIKKIKEVISKRRRELTE